jgi:hypothetical protein
LDDVHSALFANPILTFALSHVLPINQKNISQEKFDEYRTAELKHGRAAMLAVLGYIAPETYRFGFDIAPGVSTNDIPNGVAAIDFSE